MRKIAAMMLPLAALAAQPLGAQNLEIRIGQLERRVQQLEQALLQGAGRGAVSFDTNESCGVSGCTYSAQYVCSRLGYTRSVPGRTVMRDGYEYMLSVTCA